MNLGALFDPVFEKAPERPAMVIGDETVTYGQLGEGVASAASALSGTGVEPGHRVALVDECSLLFVAGVLGAARIGAATAPMNHRLAPDEVRALHHLAGCERSIAGDEHVDLLGAALGISPLPPSIVLGWGGPLPEPAAVADDDEALVLFTSGTTGLPKPVPLSHADLSLRVQLFAGPFDPARDPAVALMCMPVVHVGGLVGLLVALGAGSTSVVQRKFDAGDWLRLVEEHGVQRAFLVPAMLRRILDHPDFGSRDVSTLTSLAYGAAPASADLVARAVDAFPGVEFSNVFGQTETVGAVTSLGPDDHRDASKIGSVGRPLPGLEWRIVSEDDASEVQEGEVGELEVHQHGAWHATGDLVRVDADGYLWAEGRLSDTINRGGEKLGPVEVESVLLAHAAVRECAVAGIPDEELGERVGAAVVVDADVTTDDLKAWCRERLAPWKVPERIAVVDEIPLTELGKVSRPRLALLIERSTSG